LATVLMPRTIALCIETCLAARLERARSDHGRSMKSGRLTAATAAP
jgi:hypothetical protein